GDGLALAAAAPFLKLEAFFVMSPPRLKIYFTQGEHIRCEYRAQQRQQATLARMALSPGFPPSAVFAENPIV
ncbi:hypothetical protein, partial [Mesorhizobium sp.]|uniref:hypothetical protein n=1 Tax=Mesorhizobium sp. TaxID=1871066 RepID=UPI0025DCF00F